MKSIKYIVLGIVFGIVMTKSEAVSWYRIWEMFQFRSFHMFGIIGTALFFGVIWVQLFKKGKIKDASGNIVKINDKNMSIVRYSVGGVLFGLGWALAGACPGPMFTLLGNGYLSLLIVIFFALVGTFIYGVFRSKLPH